MRVAPPELRDAVTPAPYKKDPIAEALVELRFQGEKPWDSSGQAILGAFAAAYPGARRELKTFAVRADWSEGRVTSQAEAEFSRWLLPDASGLELVGLGPGVLSLHVLAPYPGWKRFRESLDRTFGTYRALASPITLARVTVRYIDQILVPRGEDFRAYFAALPGRLDSEPRDLQAFQISTESVDPTGVSSRLSIVSGPRTDDASRVVVYDLDLGFEAPVGTKADAWPEIVERLHDREKAIFEHSITDKMKELFNA